MNGGILALTISLVGTLTGIIGWFSGQYWQRRSAKRQDVRFAVEDIKEGKAVIKEKIDKTKDATQQKELRLLLDEVDATLLVRTQKALQFLRRER